jgi:hypothetical protein
LDPGERLRVFGTYRQFYISLTGENVYVTHYGATAASPALIGPFNVINSSEHFQRERGQNPLVPKYVHATITTAAHMATSDPEVICTAALLVSFWFGRSADWLAWNWEGMNDVI